MAEDAKSSPASGGNFSLRIRGPRDFYGGLVLVALAVFALWAGSDLAGMRGFSFGPGTTPRLFAMLLIAVGAAISISGLFVDGPPIESYALRGPAFVVCAILVFAITIRGFRFSFFGFPVKLPELGLIASTFMAYMISVMGGREIRWTESLIAGAIMTAFCVVLFRYLLQLPFPLWPTF
ncbi:tripartite tricarboxylate transporter TctB family protein [Undibacter mobilis]|uniref:Tripartite tricarboxylate transporter TctB family protein n=1 Tax=Undibacter mobilis TaxID=2292256 RepID=A0A371BBS9_9BRAD|nr:tripartite tricarboxylate transporter TctB family protein [Undibacter mobilis]RDV05022.1 tripartite tricarboxylate transporter TctB family protein [Undibacter mobilis]